MLIGGEEGQEHTFTLEDLALLGGDDGEGDGGAAGAGTGAGDAGSEGAGSEDNRAGAGSGSSGGAGSGDGSSDGGEAGKGGQGSGEGGEGGEGDGSGEGDEQKRQAAGKAAADGSAEGGEGDGKGGAGSADEGAEGESEGKDKGKGVTAVDWGDEKKQIVAAYPEDQREKVQKVLDKYASKTDAYRALAAADSKIAELGDKAKGLVKVPGKDAKPEDIEAFDKAWGVPEAADDYKIEREEGFEPTALDTEFEKQVRTLAKEQHFNQEQVNALVKLDLARQKMVEDAQLATATQLTKAAEDDLRVHFGVKQYPVAVEMVERFWEKQVLPHFADGEALDLRNTLMADGRPLLSHPGLIKALAQISLDYEDMGAFVDGEPMTGANIQAEIDKIKEKQGTDEYTDEMAGKLNKLLQQQKRLKANTAKKAA